MKLEMIPDKRCEEIRKNIDHWWNNGGKIFFHTSKATAIAAIGEYLANEEGYTTYENKVSKPKDKPVVKQEWTEYERGWGCRPDGFTLHLNKIKMEEFNKDYMGDRDGPTPDVYISPGVAEIVDVDEDVYEKIKESEFGIWGYKEWV